MHIFFSAGEPSGDQHAAQLIKQLQKRESNLRCSGYGGTEMASAGLEMHFQLTNLAVMGFFGVIPLIRQLWQLYKQAEAFFERERPDAVVLVDFPGFNWWIAKAAKRANLPVYYYCPPQLWAWAPWRIKKVRKWIDCILSVLPFEAKWYRDRGIDVEYVGHPFFDEVAQHPLNEKALTELHPPGSTRLGLLPGSRRQEVNRNFPVMLEMVELLHQRHPHVRFPVACYKQWHYDRCAELLDAYPVALPVDLYLQQTSEIIASSDCCLMVSGSVSLEMLARRTPAVVIYRAGFLTYWIAYFLGTCNYITLPNLLADRPLMPECPFVRKRGRHIRRLVDILDRWLQDPMALAAVRKDVSQLAETMVEAGGVERAARVLHERILQSRPNQPNLNSVRAAA